MKRYAFAAVAMTLAAGTPVARAQPDPEGGSALSTRAADGRERVGRLELGYRGLFVTNSGYNPFSTDDYFSGVSLALSRTVATSGHFSFAPGVSWDYGASAATARDDSTSLKVNRLTVPLEGRLLLGRWGYAFARVAPGVAVERAEVDDPSSPGPLTKSNWLFTADASAGYAFAVLSLPARSGPATHVWIQGDAGYSWIIDNRLDLLPATSGDGQTTAGVDLGSLGLRGAFLRFALAISY